MWTFNSDSGTLSHDGAIVTIDAWSGHDEGRNNSALEQHPNLGPIPRGEWEISEAIPNTETHGPIVMRLMPCEGTNTYGRGGFLIHGASATNPGQSSKGCLILPRSVRTQIAASPDRILQVV